MSEVERAQALTEKIGTMLHGQGPDVQGAVLLDLVAMWLAGHHPELRQHVLQQWLASLPAMVALNRIIPDDQWPEAPVQ